MKVNDRQYVLGCRRPGDPWRDHPRCTDSIDVSNIPQVSDEDRAILGDPTYEGTPEQRAAHARAMLVLREIRVKKGLPVD